jgi:predicted DNA-binding protein (MmcQ/YjbR family)
MNTEQLREFCLSLPGVTEDIKWGNDLCFLIGGKMFCVTGVAGDSHTSFKVKDEEFEELCERPGIIPAPYMARNKWVAVTAPGKLNTKEWKHYVRQSYEMILSKLPKKVQLEIQSGT